jgi:hypothetical protein
VITIDYPDCEKGEQNRRFTANLRLMRDPEPVRAHVAQLRQEVADLIAQDMQSAESGARRFHVKGSTRKPCSAHSTNQVESCEGETRGRTYK